MEKGDKYISIVVAKYALLEVIEALADGGLTEYTITQEDSNLVIVIPVKKLKEVKNLKLRKIERSFVSNE